MGQLVLGTHNEKTIPNETKVSNLEKLNSQGYLNAHFSAEEIKELLSTFGNIEQYLISDEQK